MELKVFGLKGKNYYFQIINLLYFIFFEFSLVKVKFGCVIFFLKKDKDESWFCLIVIENLKNMKEQLKVDDKKDFGEGIMDLMRKMYDEGDDEMKRIIVKVWMELREKQNLYDLLFQF